MAERLTVKKVLTQAIEKEIESQRLYAKLAEMVTSPIAEDTFRDLVQQEKLHENVLERYLHGELKKGALRVEQEIDYKIAENYGDTEISPDMELKNIFLRAANREKAANEGYLSLAEAHPAGEVRRLLEELASQELEHKHRLEYLFTEVAFPQTDGG